MTKKTTSVRDDVTRIVSPMLKPAAERLTTLCDRWGTSPTRLFECLMKCEDREIEAILVKYNAAAEKDRSHARLARTVRRQAERSKKEVLKRLEGLSPEARAEVEKALEAQAQG